MQLSVGDWSPEIDQSLLTNADKDLILDNQPIITFYEEDNPDLSNYEIRNTVSNWDNLSKEYAKEDHLGCKFAIEKILNEATGINEQERFNTFSRQEQEIIIKYNSLTDDNIGVTFYMQEDGYGITESIQFYSSIRFKSMECVATSCFNRYNNKGGGWYPIIFKYYSKDIAISIKGSVDSFKNIYVEDGVLGTQWGDIILSLLDFINGTGGIGAKLEDFELIEGMIFEDVRKELTEYFYKRWT